MKALVPIKRVIDYEVHIQVKKDNSGVETDNVKMSMNPFDEIALEEAVRQKELGKLTEIIAVSIGSKASEETLRTALANGADRAILIETDQELEPFNIAKILKHIVLQESPDLVMMGKQSIDGDHNQTGQMLAALLDWPQGTFISKLKIAKDAIHISREVDNGIQAIKLSVPAVITVDLRLNNPRLPALPEILKAKKKPLDIIPVKELKIDLSQRIKLLKVESPIQRKKRIVVKDVNELIRRLREDAQVIG